MSLGGVEWHRGACGIGPCAYAPERLIGDRAYDSDPLDERLRTERGIEMIARHRSNRKRPKTQDGRALRRVLRRWKIERLFARLQRTTGVSSPAGSTTQRTSSAASASCFDSFEILSNN